MRPNATRGGRNDLPKTSIEQRTESALQKLDLGAAFHAVVNGHFATTPPDGAPAMLGLHGGTA